jgi:hypothetical protein
LADVLCTGVQQRAARRSLRAGWATLAATPAKGAAGSKVKLTAVTGLVATTAFDVD